MSETIESNSEILAHVNDLIYNIRTEVKEIHPLNESVEKMKTELNTLRKEIKKIEEKIQFPDLCPACGKPLMPEFKICPYCGENIKLLREEVVSLESYR